MAFRIAPFPGQAYGRNYADHRDIRAYLGFGRLVERSFGDGHTYKSIEAMRLPTDFSESGTWVPLTDGRHALLSCAPGHRSTDGRRGKSSRHRCHVQCPDCGAQVPAGRAHQHKCKGGDL